MGCAGTALCSLFANATHAIAIVPPAMGGLAVIAYITANWRMIRGR
jgi:hypothetical protein